MADIQQTLIIIKPDGVQRGLTGEILTRLERRGLKIVKMELRQIDAATAAEHYAEHEGKGFYQSLVDYITSRPSVPLVVEGPDAIAVVRSTVGSTRPAEAAPGTIRGDFGLTVGRNLIHASDSPESALREIEIFFGSGELVSHPREIDRWIDDSLPV